MKRLASHRAKEKLCQKVIFLGFRVKNGSLGEKRLDKKAELRRGQAREKGGKKGLRPWRRG